MQGITLYTLFDITNTRLTKQYRPELIPYTIANGIVVDSEEKWDFARRQQRNYETITQILMLRSQIFDVTTNMIEDTLTKFNFGSAYSQKKKNTIWMFRFKIEMYNVYDTSDGKFKALYDDIVNIPMITGLSETTQLQPYFQIDEQYRNVYFEEFEVGFY